MGPLSRALLRDTEEQAERLMVDREQLLREAAEVERGISGLSKEWHVDAIRM